MKQKLILLTLFLLLFQWYARYAVAPAVDFTLDDWALLRRAEGMTALSDVWRMMAQEPDRPVGALSLSLCFRVFGDAPLRYNILGYLANSACLLALIGIAWQLTRHRLVVLVAGVFYAVLPILTESYHWPTMICYGFGFAATSGSAYFWLRYVRDQKWGDLLASVVLFGISLGNYELGIGLPVAYALVWVWRRPWRSGIPALLPFCGVIVLYLSWRFTRGFGLAPGLLFAPRTPSFSLYGLFYNARDIVSWWAGGNLLDTFRQGFNGYAQMPLWPRRWFFVGNVAAVAAVAALAYRLSKTSTVKDAGLLSPVKTIVWALLWVALTHSLSLVSWTAGRINLIPAVGMAVAAGVMVARFRLSSTLPVLTVLVLTGLFAVQGTAYQWKESGMFNRRLNTYLADHHAQWQDKEVVWFDTRAMRSRVEQGLLAGISPAPSTWAHYGNAGLIRGFAPSAMLARLVPKGQPIPAAVLDTEYTAYREGDWLIWHERYDPSKPRQTPMEQVFRVDCLAAGQTE